MYCHNYPHHRPRTDACFSTGHVITAKPTTYQLGDLVEVGFTIAGTPLRGDRVAFKPLLNYLMLRDSTDLEVFAPSTQDNQILNRDYRSLPKSKERRSERTYPKRLLNARSVSVFRRAVRKAVLIEFHK